MIMPVAPLFVPAHKTDLYAKAENSAADAIFLDLEDAVSNLEKDAARQGLLAARDHINKAVAVRINDRRSAFFHADCDAVKAASITTIILPKCEGADDITALRDHFGDHLCIMAMIESVKGLSSIDDILSQQAISGVIFGNLDFALDCGLAPTRNALAYARGHIVTKARLHNSPAPLDGISPDFTDLSLLQSDLLYAKEMGFGGRLCIHPNQTDATIAAFSPSKEEIARAKAILEAAHGHSVAQYEGKMIDKPVLEAAKRLLKRAETTTRVTS